MTSPDDTSASGPVATLAGLPVDAHDHLLRALPGEAQRDELMVDFLAEGVQARHKCYCAAATWRPAASPRIACCGSGRSGDDHLRAQGPELRPDRGGHELGDRSSPRTSSRT